MIVLLQDHQSCHRKKILILEHLRGKVSNSYGNLFSMMTIFKGLPLSYFKDLQDDKKIVFDTFDNLINSIKILNDVLKNFSVNKV